ncbi:uncharacterized protein AAES06_020307 isoform 2-T2 [Glossophaga mutica]
MEEVMINRARYKKIKLNPGFGNENVTGGLRDSRFSGLVREEAEGSRNLTRTQVAGRKGDSVCIIPTTYDREGYLRDRSQKPEGRGVQVLLWERPACWGHSWRDIGSRGANRPSDNPDQSKCPVR